MPKNKRKLWNQLGHSITGPAFFLRPWYKMPGRGNILLRNRRTGRIRVVGRRRYGAARRVNVRRGMITRGVPSVYSFKRKVFYADAISLSAGGPQYANTWSFQLALLPSSTDFTNLYDQYMIKKVVWTLIPKVTQNEINSGSAGNADLPSVHSVLDYDDGTNPTSISQLCEYQTHKMTRGNALHTRVFVPKVELNVTSPSGLSRADAPKAYQWLDADEPTINHRGIKVVIPPPITPGTQLFYDVLVTYYFSMKSVL